eukprot:730806-Pleurochrysis_carterae.AAC.1
MKQSEFESIHVLYDDAAKHYEYFARHTIAEDTRDRLGMEVQDAERGKEVAEREKVKAKAVMTENLRKVIKGEGETLTENNRRESSRRE